MSKIITASNDDVIGKKINLKYIEKLRLEVKADHYFSYLNGVFNSECHCSACGED